MIHYYIIYSLNFAKVEGPARQVMYHVVRKR